MPELIFIIIFSVFICGMFICDEERDKSRMLRPYQKKALDDACQAFRRLGVAAQNCGGKSALFHQAVGRSKRNPPYFIYDEKLNSTESEKS